MSPETSVAYLLTQIVLPVIALGALWRTFKKSAE